MRAEAKRHDVRKAIGWLVPTPVEILFGTLIAIMLVWGVLPHYERWNVAKLLEEEQHAVMRVRASLSMYRESSRPCPDRLDDCPDGATTMECGFFVEALGKPIQSPGWVKKGNTYRGPAGGYYRYDPDKCQIIQISRPVEE